MPRMLTLAEFASEAPAERRPARGAGALNRTPGGSPSDEQSRPLGVVSAGSRCWRT